MKNQKRKINNMAFYNLPKRNKRAEQSELMLLELEGKLLDAIKDIEKKYEYQFAPYEIDCMLLKKIVRHHEAYLRNDFKPKKQIKDDKDPDSIRKG
jgi:hypothetical protein